MKDAYSFDLSLDSADLSYQAMYDAYVRIFARCGLRTKAVEADTGDIGGKWSHEFMVMADAGEDAIVECTACSYGANQERAERQVAAGPAAPDSPAPAPVTTPGLRTIEEVARFLACPPSQMLKTLLYAVDGQPVAVLVAGDRELNEHKLKRALSAAKVELADEATILKTTGAPVGFAGPIGLNVPVYADIGLQGARDCSAGANQADTHVRHVDLSRDARVVDYLDLAVVGSDDACPRCGGRLQVTRGIEVGHVFKLGTKYAETFQARYLTDKGQTETMVMGCYGIGVTRTLQAVIEQCHDGNGIIWPASVAPYAVGLLLLDPKDAAATAAAERLAADLEAQGIDVLLDDRDERAGVKFKDADLIGFPFRVVVGTRALAKGGVELKSRTSSEAELLPLEQAPATIAARVRAAIAVTGAAIGATPA